jgi:RNA polymerase sigma-70 factor (ECF subfamily)
MHAKEQQFKELFLSEYGRMYKAAYILLGDEDEAKDVVQDIFAKLWDGTVPIKEESQRTFLLTCVRNRCLNIIAQRQTHQEVIRFLTPEAIDSEVYDEEIVNAVNRYVDERLTPQTSRIIKMHFNEDQSYKEISNSLGISLSAVNKHIVQGLRKLRSTFKTREA